MGARRFTLLLALGALLRLAALPLVGTYDVEAWREWSATAARDLGGIYRAGQTITPAFSYPPVSAYEFAAIGHANRLLDPDGASPRAFSVLIKLPGVVAELALFAVILIWGVPRFGATTARRMAIALWLNPAMVLAGSVLGYLDAQAAIPSVLAVFAAAAGSPAAAGALALMAALTKPQAVFVLPAIAIVLWRHSPRQALIAAGAGAAFAGASFAFFAWRGGLAPIWRSIADNIPDMVSGQAANVWWVLTWWVQRSSGVAVGVRSAADLAASGYPGVNALGVGLAGVTLLWGLWRSRRVTTIDDGALCAAWCVHAYATLSIAVHENHLALAVPFLMVAAGLRRELRPLAAAVTLIVTANMALFYGFGEAGWRLTPSYARTVIPGIAAGVIILGFRTARDLPRAAWLAAAGVAAVAAGVFLARGVPHSLETIRMVTGVDATMLLALLNIAVFAWHTRVLWQVTATESASIPP